MLNPVMRDVTNSDIEEIRSFLDNEPIRYSLGVFSSKGNKFRDIRFISEEDSLTVHVLPCQPTQTVSDEAENVDCYAVVVDHSENSAGMVSEEAYKDIDVLPELRQAFHEGNSFMDREADYRYHFNDDSSEIAVSAADPVDRLEKPIEITKVEFLGGFAPRKWLLETSDGQGLYLRERSGSIRLYDDVKDGEEIFNAYIGGEHPGTSLKVDGQSEDSEYSTNQDEVIGIVTAVNYINVVDNPEISVSDDVRDRYHESVEEVFAATDDFADIAGDLYDGDEDALNEDLFDKED